MTRTPPTHDAQGLNIADPNDTLGIKSDYITTLHAKAMRRYFPRGEGRVLDVGCGFGRLTPRLAELGYTDVRGIDPDPTSIAAARELNPGPTYDVGGLPDLPVDDGSVDLLLFQHLLRPLKLLGRTDLVDGCARYLADEGRLVVVDNVWPGRDTHWEFDELTGLLTRQGLAVERWHQIRRARWWPIVAIRYGLVPRRWLDRIAEHELDQMANRRSFPRWQYINTILVFAKT